MGYTYLGCTIHIILEELSQPHLISDFVELMSKIVIGVVSIIGIMYIKPLKDKTMTATFTFWSQLKVRLTEIRVRLEADEGILWNIYEQKSQEKLSPTMPRVQELKKEIQNTLDYIKNTPDQMPAYQGWSGDYTRLISLLEDCLVYDICDDKHHFKLVTDDDEIIVDYNTEIRAIISKICSEIDRRQKYIEKKIVKKLWKKPV